MSLLKSLVKNLRQQVAGRRTWTPSEVRELIDRKQLDEAREALEHLPESLDDREAVRAGLLGEVLFRQGDDEGSLGAFREALRGTPGAPSAHYGLSLGLAESGAFDDALRHAYFALSVEPNDPRFLAQVGYCQLRLQNYPLAEGPLRRATLLAPSDEHVWNNLGIVLLMKGALAEAHDCFRRALALNPSLASAADNLARLRSDLEQALGHALEEPFEPMQQALSSAPSGEDSEVASPALADVRALEHEGELQAALSACEDLILDEPDSADFVLKLHRLYLRAGDPASGIDALRAFRSRHPEHPGVAAALGLAWLEMREFRRAEGLLRQAHEAEPEALQTVLGLAQTLAGQERFAEAAPLFDLAVELAPGNLPVLAAKAGNLVSECRYEEALQLYEDTEGLRAPALGLVYAYLGRFDKAIDSLDQNVALQPNDPQLRFARASVRLLQQDFERGWEDYSFRGMNLSDNFRVLPFPLWKGEPLEGRRVLVLAEQGLGDQVMFASCLPDLLAQRPAELIVEAVHRIAPTIARSFPQCRVIPTDQGRKLDWLKDCPDVDCYVPLAELPRYFRRSLQAFPSHRGYLVPDAGRVAYWRGRLAEAGPGPYIGFSWKGGTESTRTSLRTIDVMDFAPLASVRSATWVCLQYGPVAERVTSAREAGFEMAYWPESIADLDEFAALVSALDLVVTVCNTTVHYAGATGRPVWVLAPKVPEWRYGAENRTMPWYPSSVVFRQFSAGDWTQLLERVRRELTTWDAAATVAA